MSDFCFRPLAMDLGEEEPGFGIGIGINTTIHYDSISGSVANRIEEANGRLLPVDAPAFEREMLLQDFKFSRPDFSWFKFETELGTGLTFNNPREFYEHLGITIQEPQDDMPGWYQCRLPDGWYTERTAITFSRDEGTHFCDETGKTRFTIISQKDGTNQCSNFTTLLRT